jgi:hypothetical protein
MSGLARIAASNSAKQLATAAFMSPFRKPSFLPDALRDTAGLDEGDFGMVE